MIGRFPVALNHLQALGPALAAMFGAPLSVLNVEVSGTADPDDSYSTLSRASRPLSHSLLLP
jgi:hypothetical protein